MAKSRAARLALFIVAVAASGGVGYGAGDWLTRPADAAPTAEAAGEDMAPLYVDVGQLIAPIMEDGRTRAFILAKITLQANDAERAERLRRELPRARSVLLQGLFQLAGNGIFDRKVIDPAGVADSLRQTLAEKMGDGMVQAVLMDRLLRQENARL